MFNSPSTWAVSGTGSTVGVAVAVAVAVAVGNADGVSVAVAETATVSRSEGVGVCDGIVLPADGEVATQLEVEPGAPVVRFRRVRSTPSHPHSWVVNHLPAEIGRSVDLEELRTRSLLRLIDDSAWGRLVSGYEIISAALEVSKNYAVFSDPFGSGKALPGAVIEYTITVDNSTGSTDATDVSISDTIDGDVTFLLGQYGGAGQDISIDNGGVVSTCSADAAAGDTDGCSLDVDALVIGNTNGPITVAAGDILTVQFRVEIPNL